MPKPPDRDDVRQEVELQRLLGRRVSARHVRSRMMREEALRGEAEREYATNAHRHPPPPIDPVKYPILYDKIVRRLTPRELLEVHNCRSRQTLSRKVREEADRYMQEFL